MTHDLRVRDHIDAGGVRTYYEASGDGEPVVLLHGGMCTIETWTPQWAALAARHRVIAPERRGHGRTRDVSGPITFEMMADDTIAFMSALGLTSAHVVGWSDGAAVGALVALKRPDLVRKLAYVSQPTSLDAIPTRFRAQLQGMTVDHLPPMLRQAYQAVSPDGPEHYPVIAGKMLALWKEDPGGPVSRFAALEMPVLVMVGDDDIQSVGDAAAMQQAIRGAQLAVIPGASHGLLMEKPELVNRILLDFLAPEQTTKRFAAGE